MGINSLDDCEEKLYLHDLKKWKKDCQLVLRALALKNLSVRYSIVFFDASMLYIFFSIFKKRIKKNMMVLLVDLTQKFRLNISQERPTIREP